MEYQNLIKGDCSKRIQISNISGSGGHKDTKLDVNCLALGQLLWAKGVQCSWWPAQVVDERTVSENNILNDRIEGGVLVRFYGSYNYAWVDPLADLSRFWESFKGEGSNHLRAFQKALEEMLNLNKPCVELGGISKFSATPFQHNKSGDEKTATKVSICKSAKGEEPENIQSQGKLKEKARKTAKVEESEKMGSQVTRKERVPKNVKVEEHGQTRSQGKSKEKPPKNAEGDEPKQIQSIRKRKEKAPKSTKGQEHEKIRSPGKRKEKTAKRAKTEELESVQNQGKGKEKTPKKAKGEDTDQTPIQVKKKEKVPSDASQKSQGKSKEKGLSDARDIVADGSDKKVRQIRVMRQLGLVAPAGSPFSANFTVKSAT